MSQLIIPVTDFRFESILEIAAVKRTVVDIELVKEPSVWHKIFVDRVVYEGDRMKLKVKSSAGNGGEPLKTSYYKDEMKSVAVGDEGQDLEVISCLCR